MFSKPNLSAPRCQSLTKNLYQKLEMDCRSPDVWTQVKQVSSPHQVSLGGTERPFQAGNYLSADSYPLALLVLRLARYRRRRQPARRFPALPAAAAEEGGGCRRRCRDGSAPNSRWARSQQRTDQPCWTDLVGRSPPRGCSCRMCSRLSWKHLEHLLV